jgi:hypothetical protein
VKKERRAGGKRTEERIAWEVRQKECEKKRKGKRGNCMRRIKIGHQMREHGGKNEERIKHKNKKQTKAEKLVAGKKKE